MRLALEVPMLSFHLCGGLSEHKDGGGLLVCIVPATRILEPKCKRASDSKRMKYMAVTLLLPYLGSMAGNTHGSWPYFPGA